MLLLSGPAFAIQQYLWTKALVLAPASAVGPFYYFSLVWALVIGFVVWGDMPTTGLVIGSGIVVASGLFLLCTRLTPGGWRLPRSLKAPRPRSLPPALSRQNSRFLQLDNERPSSPTQRALAAMAAARSADRTIGGFTADAL
jgi:hypothetical protein